MTGSAWAAAALICLHLNSLGALPPEIQAESVRPYLTGQQAIRVLLAEDVASVQLHPRSVVTVENTDTGARVAVAQAGASLSAKLSRGRVALVGPGLKVSSSQLALTPSTPDAGVTLSFKGGRGRRGLYSGRLEITAAGRGLRVIEEVDLETYVAGVVAAELPSYFPLEAMKAQAIAARTYTLYHLGGHDQVGADICGDVHCQAYHGKPSITSRARKAVQETAGEVLLWNGLLIDAMYHAACGGTGATAWKVRQSKLLPYLQGQSDRPEGERGAPYCSWDHEVSWRKRFSYEEANRLVSKNLGAVAGEPGLSPGKLINMHLLKDEITGRATWLEVQTSKGIYRVRGDAIRWLFGNGRPGPKGLRSTAFDMIISRAAAGRPRAFEFVGRGHGHGLGLCQWGARGRAEAWQSAEEILAAYYPGAIVANLRN